MKDTVPASTSGAHPNFDFSDDALSDELTSALELVEERLVEHAGFSDDNVDDASHYLLAAGGKRIRPLLVLLAAMCGSGINDDVLDAAAAVELTHLATLYHDDVMDSATTRRGAPAAHTVWSNSLAILTGDLLFARASRLSARLGRAAVVIHSETFERLCLGQFHETVGPVPGEDSREHYLDVLRDKTGSLISTSARYGAMFGGCDAEVVRALGTFGEEVGLAFQLADDVLDIVGDSFDSGKTPGTDLREEVVTMPLILLTDDEASAVADPATASVRAALAEDLSVDSNLAVAVERFRRHPVIDETRKMAFGRADSAISALDALPDSPARRALVSFAKAVVDRAA